MRDQLLTLLGQAFLCCWIVAVTVVGIRRLIEAVGDLRTGASQWELSGTRIAKGVRPVEFWLSVGGKLATALLIAPLLVLFGFWELLG